MNGTLFALVNCNNFYASREKLFDPTLADTPLVALSNNGGCVVARSAEVKTTVVHVHNLLGRVYMLAVKPWHRRIAPAVLSRLDGERRAG